MESGDSGNLVIPSTPQPIFRISVDVQGLLNSNYVFFFFTILKYVHDENQIVYSDYLYITCSLQASNHIYNKNKKNNASLSSNGIKAYCKKGRLCFPNQIKYVNARHYAIYCKGVHFTVLK